ncbi:Uncharacterized protein ACMD2_05884 [Ananas comosus]|uniref:Uncharacterized protein n=1 Tax=Ananas comosus TaxID=4615 RepID=A0A199UNE7_ANACO|nr:Uncharacterized protein ACMD2_05884 [Ananas comosus]
MGNSIGGKRRTAKVMMIDGTTLRLKAPAQALDALRDHPGFAVLESEEVKRVGLRARPLDPDAPLKPGKLYFLVDLPRADPEPDHRHASPRRAWSGALRVGARERLESLMLSRRSASDMALARPRSAAAIVAAEPGPAADAGAVRIKLRLPKSQVAKLMEESRDAAEAAERIMELCVAASPDPIAASGNAKAERKEVRSLD